MICYVFSVFIVFGAMICAVSCASQWKDEQFQSEVKPCKDAAKICMEEHCSEMVSKSLEKKNCFREHCRAAFKSCSLPAKEAFLERRENSE